MELLSDLVKEYLSYHSDTGLVLWAKNPNTATTRIKAGDIAGRLHPTGYHTITLRGKTLRRARVAWFLSAGVWPENQIDHINGVKNDDRLVNLREATAAENSQNRKSRGNMTGVKGVQYCRGRYIASVTYRGQYHYVGCFRDLNSAKHQVELVRARLHQEFTKHV